MSVDVPYELFWKLNPHKLKPFIEAHKLKMKMYDEMMWMMGAYVTQSVLVGVEHNLAGAKAKSKYYEEPFTHQQQEEQKEMSDESKMNIVRSIFASLETRKANFEINH